MDAFTRVSTQNVAQIAAQIDWSVDAPAPLKDGQKPHELVAALAEQRRWPEAIKFLAHLLPHRDGAWWGCLCAWQAKGEALPALELQVLRAAVAWVLESTDEQRRALKPLSKEVGMKNPAGLIARAVFASGGSMTPPELPAVPPRPEMFPNLLGSAILLAAAQGKMVEMTPKYQQFLALGIAIAQGKYPWPSK